MSRVKRGTASLKKRKKVLSLTKGYKWGRKSKERAAKEALLHGLSRQFRGRKEKKRVYRRLWNVKINAAARDAGLTYSALFAALKKNKILLNRKMLADLAEHEPNAFREVVAKVRG